LGSATSDLCELAHQGNWLITVQDENKQACRETRLTHHQSLVTFLWVTLTVQQNLEKLREALLIKIYTVVKLKRGISRLSDGYVFPSVLHRESSWSATFLTQPNLKLFFRHT
jgi:hypothetical protein